MKSTMRIVYELTLKSAALLTCDGTDANTVTTWPFVPGRTVLGALAGRWLARQGGSVSDPAASDLFRRLFLSGNTRFLHAYPAPDGVRLLPAPHSLFVRKSSEVDDKELYERALTYPLTESSSVGREVEQEFKKADRCFIRMEGDQVVSYQPATRLHMHHQRDRAKGRPTTNTGAIFHYEAIQAGERFIGAMEVDGEESEQTEDCALLTALLSDGPLLLGRSRGAEYGGQAEVKILPLKSWAEVSQKHTGSAESPPSDVLAVTLLSEYLGRDAVTGVLTPDAFESELRREFQSLGGELGSLQRSFVERQHLSGYVSVWRMPQPTVQVLAAGSVFVFSVNKPLSEQRPGSPVLTLGERRAEGCGRVALHWPGLLQTDSARFSLRKNSSPAPRPMASKAEDAAVIALKQNMLAQWLMEQIPGCAAAASLRKENLPSPSVLGGLRSMTSSIGATHGMNRAEIEKEVRNRLGKKITDKLEKTAPPFSGWAQNFFEWLLKTMEASEKPDIWFSQLETVLQKQAGHRSGFLEGVNLPKASQQRIRYALLDAVLDNARRLAAKQDGN
jgi:CRISPR-associated Csx10 family RAMP protein